MTTKKAIAVLYNALSDYTENSISGEDYEDEREELEKAWNRVLKDLRKVNL